MKVKSLIPYLSVFALLLSSWAICPASSYAGSQVRLSCCESENCGEKSHSRDSASHGQEGGSYFCCDEAHVGALPLSLILQTNKKAPPVFLEIASKETFPAPLIVERFSFFRKLKRFYSARAVPLARAPPARNA